MNAAQTFLAFCHEFRPVIWGVVIVGSLAVAPFALASLVAKGLGL